MPNLEDKNQELTNKGLKGEQTFDYENSILKQVLADFKPIGGGAEQFSDVGNVYDRGLVSPEISPREAEGQGGIYELGAKNQSGWGLFGNALGQVATELTLGTLEGIGYLPEIAQVFDTELAAQKEFGNSWTEFFRTAKENANEDLFPILQTTESQGFEPGNAIWWATNAATIGTALSLMVPGLAVTKGASLLGEAAGMSKALAGITGAVVGGMYSRYSENFLEAKGKFDESYDYYVNERGLSEEEAKLKAAKEASDTWKFNAAMLPLDILQYTGLMKGMGSFDDLAKGLTNGFAKRGVKAVGFLKQMGSEAVEEGFQYVAGKEAEAKEREGKTPFFDGEFTSRLADYIEDPEMQTSMFWGAIGGGVFEGGGPAISKLYDRAARSKLYYDSKKTQAAQFKDAEAFNKVSEEELLNNFTTQINIAKAKKQNISEAVNNIATNLADFKEAELSKIEDKKDREATTKRIDKHIARLRTFATKFDALDKSDIFAGNDTLKMKYLASQMELDMLQDHLEAKRLKAKNLQLETKASDDVLAIGGAKAKVEYYEGLLEEISKGTLKGKKLSKKEIKKNTSEIKNKLDEAKVDYTSLKEEYLKEGKEEDLVTNRDVELGQLWKETEEISFRIKKINKAYNSLQKLDAEAAAKMQEESDKASKEANKKAAKNAGKTAQTEEDLEAAINKGSEVGLAGEVLEGHEKETDAQLDNLKKSSGSTATVTSKDAYVDDIGTASIGTLEASLLSDRTVPDSLVVKLGKNPKAYNKIKKDILAMISHVPSTEESQTIINRLSEATTADEFARIYQVAVDLLNNTKALQNESPDLFQKDVTTISELEAILNEIDRVLNIATTPAPVKAYEAKDKTIVEPVEEVVSNDDSVEDVNAETKDTIEESTQTIPAEELIAESTPTDNITFDPYNLNVAPFSNAWHSAMREFEITKVGGKWTTIVKDGNLVKMDMSKDPTLEIDFDAMDTGKIDAGDEVFYTINPSSIYTQDTGAKSKYLNKYGIQIRINVRKPDGTTYVVGVLPSVADWRLSGGLRGFDMTNVNTKQSVEQQRALRDAMWSYMENSGLIGETSLNTSSVIELPSQFNSKVKEMLPGKLNHINDSMDLQAYAKDNKVILGATTMDGTAVTVNKEAEVFGLYNRANLVKNDQGMYLYVMHPAKKIYMPLKMTTRAFKSLDRDILRKVITNLAATISENYAVNGDLSVEASQTIKKYLQYTKKANKTLSLTLDTNDNIILGINNTKNPADSKQVNLTEILTTGDFDAVVSPDVITFLNDAYPAVDYAKLNLENTINPLDGQGKADYNSYVIQVADVYGVPNDRPFILTNVSVAPYIAAKESSNPIVEGPIVRSKEVTEINGSDISEDKDKFANKPESTKEVPSVDSGESVSVDDLDNIDLGSIGNPDYKGTKFGSIDDAVPNTKMADDITEVWDKTKEIEWFKARFPNIPINVLSDAKEIIAKGGSNSWAVYKDAALYIYENAGIGVIYHEAFHVVFNLRVPTAKKMALYREVRTKYKPTKSEIDNTIARYKESFNLDITKDKAERILLEEYMADKFQEYMLTEMEDKSLGRKILNFFKELLSSIKAFATNQITLNDTFYKIKNGKYNTSGLSNAEVKRFSNSAPMNKVSTWTTRKTNLVVRNINNLLFTNTLPALRKMNPDKFNGISDEEMLVTVIREIGTGELYLYIFKDIISTIQNRDKSISEAQSKRLENAVDIAFKIYNPKTGKFGELLPELERDLGNYGLIIKSNSISKSYDSTSEGNDTTLEEGINESWQVDYNKQSSKDSASFKMKQYLRSIVNTDMTVSSVVEDTGIFSKSFIEFDSLYNNLLQNISDSNSPAEMLAKIGELSGTKPGYQQIADDLSGNAPLLNTFWNTFNKPARKQMFVSENIFDKVRKFIVGEANKRNVTNLLLNKWHNGVLDNEVLVKDGVVNIDAAKSNLTLFQQSGVAKDINAIFNILDKIGISISKPALAGIYGNKYSLNDFNNQINNLLLSYAKGVNPLDRSTGIVDTKNLKALANNVKKYETTLREESHTNANGDKVFAHVTPNYNTTFFNKLKTQPDTILDKYMNEKTGDVFYIYGSTWLQDIKDDKANLEDLEYSEIDGVSLFGNEKGTYQNFNNSMLKIATLALFANNGNQNTAWYRGPVPADSSTLGIVKYKKYSDSEVVKKLMQVAHAEYLRIKNIEARLKDDNVVKITDYDTKENASLSTGFKLLPIFNKLDSKQVDINFKNIKDTASRIWIQKQINDYLATNLEEYKKELRTSGVLYEDKQGNTKLKTDETAISNSKGIDQFLKNFYWNHALAQTQITMLTVGDPAFYRKDKGSKYNTSVDFQKRSKEVISPKNNPNIDAVWIDENGKEHRINRVDGKYRYITFADKKIKSNASQAIYDTLKEYMPKSEAKLRASKYGYEAEKPSINVTDAQTYITLKFYKDTMLSNDKWNQTLENAYANLEKGKGTANDIRVILQPFKPFMFGHDLQTNEGSSNVIVPTQHKNSEFLLLPQFVEKANPELKAIYQFMVDNNVDSVLFDSAVKVGGRNVQTDYINPDVNKINTHNFEDRGIQQETPPHHIDDTNIFGTQIRKLILANLIEDVDYSITYDKEINPLTKKGSELINLYQEIITANIQEKFDEISSEFSSLESLRDFLLEKAAERGDIVELSKALEIVEHNGEKRFKLPLWFPTYGKSIESLIISIYKNNVVKQKIKGGAFVQLSSFGFDDSLELEFKDGKLTAMQVKIPWWGEKLPEKYIDEKNNISDQFIKDFPEIFEAIGYRIPTEDKYSMVPIKVVGFLPQESGGAIMLPPEITTIAGSDFDIDKLYVMLPEYEHSLDHEDVRKIKYDPSKSAADNSRKARNNMLIDIMRGILTSDSSQEALLTPGGYDSLSNYVKEVIYNTYGDTTARGDIILPQTMDAFTMDNLVAKKLIGVAANHNAIRSLFENSELAIKDSKITFGTTIASNFNRQSTIDGKQNINKNLANPLAAVVDAAKDPVINQINYNSYTANAISTLLHIGIPLENVLNFFNSKPMKELSVKAINDTKATNKELRKLVNELSKDDQVVLDFNQSLEQFNNATPGQILYTFNYVNKIADEVSSLIRGLGADRLGTLKPTLSENIEVIDNLPEYGIKEYKLLNNAQTILENNEAFRAFTEKGLITATDKLSEFIPYMSKLYKNIRVKLTSQLPTGVNLSAKDINKLNSSIDTFIFSKMPLYKMTNSEKNTLINSVPIKFNELSKKYPEKFGKNKFIAYLDKSEIKHNGLTKRILAFDNGSSYSNEQKNDIKDSIKDLFESDIKEIRDFAESIVKYSFIVNGFSFSPNSMFTLFPIEIFTDYLSNDYNISNEVYGLLEFAKTDNLQTSNAFFDQYMRHNYGKHTQQVENIIQIETINGKIQSFEIPNEYKLFGNKYPEFVYHVDIKTKKENLYQRNKDNRYELTFTLGFGNNMQEYNASSLVMESMIAENNIVVPKSQPVTPTSTTISKINISEITNHSGGALGADTAWDNIGKEFGMTNNKHYWAESRTPNGNTEISKQDFEEGRTESAKAAARNWGYSYSKMKDIRLIRNWAQVKYSDAIYAIGNIVKKGEKVFPNQTNDTRIAIAPSVTGGTGYAVGMAINHNKPVYVFNQTKGSYDIGWYKFDNSTQDFVKINTPVLTKDFAGIGTRNINDNGKQAIKDVYTKTVNNKISTATNEMDIQQSQATGIPTLENLINTPTTKPSTKFTKVDNGIMWNNQFILVNGDINNITNKNGKKVQLGPTFLERINKELQDYTKNNC